MYQELAQKFADYKVDHPNHFYKMMKFAHETQLNNDAIDYYMACPPQRMEDESYDDMKVRTQFAKKLLKYRQYLYDYSVFPIKEKKNK
jgi:hypothetical protein